MTDKIHDDGVQKASSKVCGHDVPYEQCFDSGYRHNRAQIIIPIFVELLKQCLLCLYFLNICTYRIDDVDRYNVPNKGTEN
jgi:hypothetical protein